MNSNPITDIKKLNAREIFSKSVGIIDSIEGTWKKGKRFTYKLAKQGDCNIGVQTFSKERLNSDYWCARVSDFSTLDESLKEEYYSGLAKYILGSLKGRDDSHTHFEKEYIHELTDFNLFASTISQQYIDDDIEFNSYIAELTYNFQFPLKTRKFYELICIFKKKDLSEGYVVSLCISPSNFESVNTENTVTGRYTSIEKIVFDKETKKLKWTMCTCSTPGGFIPNWLTKLNLNKAIAKDVPSFLNWVDRNRRISKKN